MTYYHRANVRLSDLNIMKSSYHKIATKNALT